MSTEKRLILIHADKGGTGKSTVARACWSGITARNSALMRSTVISATPNSTAIITLWFRCSGWM